MKNTQGEGFLVAHGRHQSILRIADTAKKQSSLLMALFSARLQIVVCVHVHDILFRHSDTGHLVKVSVSCGGVVWCGVIFCDLV